MWNRSTPPSLTKYDEIIKFRCRKVSSWQAPEDIKFSKKISERFDPSNSTPNPSVKVDYYRQPSKEPARDPRDFRNMPKPVREFKQSLPEAKGIEWIRGEPPRHILIDQISSNQIRTELNLYALLEDRFQLSDNDIINIQLLQLNNSDKLCASVLFSSGFKAWELVRSFTKFSNGLNWTMKIDSGATGFEKIKRYNETVNNSKYKEPYKHRTSSTNTSTGATYNTSNTQHTSNSSSKCNPFVPCLKIPFSCERKLPFRLEKEVLISLFPSSRFPSFSGIEEGGSSWHCHFGREIDVVEADKMFLTDVFVWKNHKFYFEEWKLVKGDAPWTIPDHYNTDKTENNISEMPNSVINDATMMVPMTDQVPDDLILKLPKFIKKRTKSESEGSDNEEGDLKSAAEIIKVKVKRKPLKKQPFVPPSTLLKTEGMKPFDDNAVGEAIAGDPMDTTEISVVTSNTISEPVLEVHEVVECPVLNSGSARTEGFFRLTAEEKRRVRFNGILEAFSSSTSASSSSLTNPNVVDSRSSRAQNRRPLLIPSAVNVTMDLFKVSPLQSAQKLVALRNSSIHSYGLVLMESAESGDLIIEYVGELVRSSVANIREWKYEREYCGDGIASSYLFRLDEIMVIDATHQGNLARFINHSCDPNCVAKTITLNGSKRIVMYAKKSIRPGEEITYDYKFPIEKDPKKKVKCLCGTSSCRKYLN